MLPPAPPTFSITIGCPNAGRMRSAMMRAAASVDPPGGNGTTSVSERDGKAGCAPAAPASIVNASASNNLFITDPCLSVDFGRTGQRLFELLQRERTAAGDIEDRRLPTATELGGVRQFCRNIDWNDDGAMTIGVNEIAGFHRHAR